MRTSLPVCGVLALHCVLCALCVPVRVPGRRTATPASDLREGAPGGPVGGAGPRNNGSDPKNRPRCGVPDFPQRKKRYVLYGGRLDHSDLTYRIVRFPRQMSEQRVRSVFSEALRVWSDVTPLSFREVLRGRADIHIDFMRYWHGDNLPFDGQGGILAHAFFPKTHRQGDIHFDNDESWTLGNHMGTDLLQVAAHEFGHVLGLQHSRVPGAVMSAFYSFSYPLKLHEDDRRGIQHLYGARQPLPRQPLPRQPLAPPTTPQAPPPPPPPPANPDTNEISPDACLSAFDAASMIRGELFFFRSGFVWRLRDGRLQSGYPALVSRHWGGLPPNIDAAFEDKTGNIWFLQGEHFWVFDAGRRLRGPEPLGSLGLTGLTGLTGPGVQAALRWGKDPDYNTLLFTAGGYWRFSPGEGRVQEPRPQSTKDIKDLPPDLDAAFRDAHGYANFIRGRHYWKFDPVGMSSLEGYPRLVGVDFFGCSNL